MYIYLVITQIVLDDHSHSTPTENKYCSTNSLHLIWCRRITTALAYIHKAFSASPELLQVAMPRPPSKHGLEKKFKAWRRGKSKNASTSSSLKQQLRGHERLLAKIPEEDAERRRELTEKIEQTKAEIASKEIVSKERLNATKSHGIRFLERQRLVRLEKAVRKSSNNEKELFKIALDQVYVAHFPHDIRYLPLFKNGNVRAIDEGKALFRRAVTRNRILKELGSEQRVTWISEDQYARVPPSWTIQLEQETFGGKREKLKGAKSEVDDRFSLSKEHEQVLDAVEKIENELDRSNGEEYNKDDTVDESDGDESLENDSESGCDNVDPMKSVTNYVNEPVSQCQKSETGTEQHANSDSDDSDESDDSSSSEDSSDDDSSDDSIHLGGAKRQLDTTEEEGDDFLVPATDENVFDKAKAEKASELVNRGDKSKGWTTQRQRPGQFKPKKQRR